MEFFRLIRLLTWEESDKSGVMGRTVPNCSAFRKRNPMGLFAVRQSKTIHCAEGDWPDFKSYTVQRTHMSSRRDVRSGDQSESARTRKECCGAYAVASKTAAHSGEAVVWGAASV